MSRRGRPPGADGAATKARIINVAREQFARRGYAATAISALAADADLAPSAIYHYFGGKVELYEAVFEQTADAIWGDIGVAARSHGTLRENLVQIVDDSRRLGEVRPHFSDFLALVPMEARLHPEFRHLLERRSKYQDTTFGALAELGIRTGELPGLGVTEATEIIRCAVMGWVLPSVTSAVRRSPGAARHCSAPSRSSPTPDLIRVSIRSCTEGRSGPPRPGVPAACHSSGIGATPTR